MVIDTLNVISKQNWPIRRDNMKEATLNFNLPLSFQQVVERVKQMPKPEKMELARLLQKEVRKSEKDITQTHFASETILAQDWLDPEEEKAWQDL